MTDGATHMDSRPDSPDTGDERWLLAQLPAPDAGSSPDPADTTALLAHLPDPEPDPGSSSPVRTTVSPEDRLARAEATLAALAKTVTRLAGALGQLDDQRSDTVPALVGGRDGDLADDDELVEWVLWLIDRYNVGHVIPKCWAEHPFLVDELDALRLGWLGTVALGRPGLEALTWHDHFRRFLAQLLKSSPCQFEHKPNTSRPAAQTHHPRRARADRRTRRRPPRT